MRYVCRLLAPRLGRSGFSQLDVLIGSAIAAMALVGVASFQTSTKAVSDGDRLKLSLASVAQELKPALSQQLGTEWNSVAAASCLVPKAMNLSFQSGDYTLAQLDKAQLDKLLPKTIQGKLNPLRKQIESLLSLGDPVTVAQKCQQVASSAVEAALCRCATAPTGYNTFKPKVVDLSLRKGLYACFFMGPNVATSSSPQSVLVPQPVIVEALYSVTRLTSIGHATCNNVETEIKAGGFGRLDYTFTLISQGSGLTMNGVHLEL